MWQWFKKKIESPKQPLIAFRMRFKVVYTTVAKKEIETGPVNVCIKAKSHAHAEAIAREFAKSRVTIKVIHI